MNLISCTEAWLQAHINCKISRHWMAHNGAIMGQACLQASHKVQSAFVNSLIGLEAILMYLREQSMQVAQSVARAAFAC